MGWLYRIEPSTKIRFLINEIQDFMKEDTDGMPNKAVVFSQWTSMLDVIGRCLEQEGIEYERLDGSMSRKKREAAMDTFRQDPKVPVFLMSLKAGNLGVNMTAGNYCYLMDPWWNPATEAQAIDRVHRLGQKRQVIVKRIIIKNSVENKIMEIQNRKQKLIEVLFLYTLFFCVFKKNTHTKCKNKNKNHIK